MRGILEIFFIIACVLTKVTSNAVTIAAAPQSRHQAQEAKWRSDPDPQETMGGVVRVVLTPRSPSAATLLDSLIKETTTSVPVKFLSVTQQRQTTGVKVKFTQSTANVLDVGKSKPSDELIKHIQRVLDRMNTLRVTVHPRIKHLYELLKKDILANRRSSFYGAIHDGENSPEWTTKKTKYGVNRPIKIFTTLENKK